MAWIAWLGNSGDIGDSGNWDGGVVPGVGDEAYVSDSTMTGSSWPSSGECTASVITLQRYMTDVYIQGGTWHGTLTNSMGYIDSGTFNGVVDNNSGTINGGIFRAQTRASTGGTVAAYPATTFMGEYSDWTGTAANGNLNDAGNWSNGVPVTGTSNIHPSGSYPLSGTCAVDVVLWGGASIGGGTFNGAVTVSSDEGGSGTITAGTFNGVVTNSGTLNGGNYTAQTRASTGGTVAAWPATQFTDDPKTTVWTGATDGDVTKSGNWDNGVPSGLDIATIPSGMPNNPTTNAITCATLTIQAGASLSCNVSSAYINNLGTISGGSFDSVSIRNDYGTRGDITGGTFNSGCSFTDQGGDIHNGTFDFAFTNNSDGRIFDGIFNGAITNNGWEINGGTFNAVVTNNSIINGGNFPAQTRESTGGTVAAFPATVFMGEGSNPGKYWYSTGDTDWDTVGNWWLDVGHTSPATDVPDGTIDVVVLASAANPVVNNASWVQPNSIDCSAAGLTFTNAGAAVTCNITGSPVFNNADGYSTGTITGNPVFNNSSYGSAYVVGDAEFKGSTNVVGGNISGTATFRNTAQVGTPITVGNCEFYDSSVNGDGVTASGNITFHNNSSNSGTIEAVNLLMLDASIDTGLNAMTLSGWKACNGNPLDDGFGKHVIEPRLTTHGGDWLVYQAPSGTV